MLNISLSLNHVIVIFSIHLLYKLASNQLASLTRKVSHITTRYTLACTKYVMFTVGTYKDCVFAMVLSLPFNIICNIASIATYVLLSIKTHGRVSVAKKTVWYTSVLFIGTTNSPFSTPCISITAGLISKSDLHILCPPYTRPCIPRLTEIGPVVYEICVHDNCPIFFTFFFFAPFYKSNFEPTNDTLLVDCFLSNLAHL